MKAFKKAYGEVGLGGKVVAVDVNPLAPGLRVADCPYVVPRVCDPSYIPDLCEICRRENVDLVLPLTDPDIPVLVRGRREIEAQGCRVIVISAEGANLAADKWLTYKFFRKIKVPTPRCWLPKGYRGGRYPVFIRPRLGSGGANSFKVENNRELEFFLSYVPNAIVSEYLPGPEITNDVICDFRHAILAVVSRERLEVRSGEVAKGRTVYHSEISRHCVTIARRLKAVGPITVQCLLKRGKPYFTEVNARFGGGAPLGIAAGVSSPQWLLSLAAGGRINTPPLGTYKTGLYLTRFDDSFVMSEEEYGRIAGSRI